MRPAKVLGGEGDMRMGMYGKALAGVQQLDKQAGVDPKAIQVRTTEPRFGLLFDRRGRDRPSGSTVTPSDSSPASAVVDATRSSGSRSPAGGSPRSP